VILTRPGIQLAPEKLSCTDYSCAAGEQLAGSVKSVDLWLLIEYRERWDREVISAFPETTRQELSALRSRIPRLRLALIRQPRRTSGPLSIFWAFAREHQPQLYRAEFTSHEELRLGTDPVYGQTSEKLFAVCTHGTHDLCCARLGNKIYSEMSSLSNNVWQISHIGGCRFAPNVVCLPHGIVYGRVEPADCAAIVSRYQDDALFPLKLRGRSCYAKPVQAAEQFLRTAKHWTALDALTVARIEESQPGHWSITFLADDSCAYRVSLVVEDGQADTYKSCSTLEPTARKKFRLIDCIEERNQ